MSKPDLMRSLKDMASNDEAKTSDLLPSVPEFDLESYMPTSGFTDDGLELPPAADTCDLLKRTVH